MTDVAESQALGLTRRGILIGSAAFGVASALPGAARTATNLHQEVAEKARMLAGGGAALRLLIPSGCAANLAPVIGAFRAATGIDVIMREVPVDDINTQLTLDQLHGSADYDLALPASFGIPDLAASGAILPLTAFARRHEPDGFRDAILYSIGDSFDGEIYGFQTDGDTYMMFYHKEWLEDPTEAARYADRFGMPLAVPKTWEELDRQMAFFHRPEEGRFGGALFRTPGYLAWEWWVRFHAKGVWPLSADLEPQIDGEAGVTALEEMIRAGASLYPVASTAGLFENWRHYGGGHIYCNIGWGGSQKYLNGPASKMRGRMVYGLTPGGRIGGRIVCVPYFNWGWNYVVSSASNRPELAYLFALFATTPEISTRSVRERDGYFDPFRSEHYTDRGIVETYSPDFLEVHRQSLEHSIPDLYLAGQGEYFRVLNEWLGAAVRGESTPEQALRRVATQWSILNLRAGRPAQLSRWRALRAKYPPELRRVLRDII